MSLSNSMKTRWSSASETVASPNFARPGQSPPPHLGLDLNLQPNRAADSSAASLIELRGVSLRFVKYYDKHYSIKRAAIDFLLRRQAPPPSSAFWALRDLNLRIGEGERVGIVGRNGAGKSSLLRLLARIYPPTHGTCSVHGKVVPLIEMGAGFNHELSGLENIYLNGALLGFRRKEMDQKLDAIWEFSELREFADMPLKYYSSGMYMRLAFSIATEIDPEILLIDEILGVGDAVFQERAKQRVQKLLDRSSAVVIVSHDMNTLRDLCLRGIWVDHGQVVQDGPIDDVIDAYMSSGS